MSFFNFAINTSSGSPSITDWLSVFIYFFTFLAAVFAACTAKKALDENKKLTKIQTEPFVDIKLEIMPESIDWIRLKISNLGLSSAFSIKFDFKGITGSKEVVDMIIREFTHLGFMSDGLNYLSKGDTRYSGFINLAEDDQERGFTVEEFLKIKLEVKITYKDQMKNNFTNIFVLSMSELNGSYTIGKNLNDQLIDHLNSINTSLVNIKVQQENFRHEYEKTHRDWTEQELRQKIRALDKKRELYKYLGKELPADLVIVRKKPSIHQIRKQMK